MATITKENIGLQHDKLVVSLQKDDYLPGYEKALKEYSKKANIPGFRKGMVPAGVIRKMYGSTVLTDELLRALDRELNTYLQNEKLDIFARPLPLDMNLKDLDVNNPVNYNFSFEVGLKPEFEVADLSKGNFLRYKVNVTDEMITQETDRLQDRYGNEKELDTVNSEEDVLNVTFTETDENAGEIEGGIRKDISLPVKNFAGPILQELMGKHKLDYIVIQLKNAFDEKERDRLKEHLGLNKEDITAEEKHFKIGINKILLSEKRELNEEFYNQLYPSQDVKTIADFRNKVKEEIQSYWDAQARNQIHDQIYHELIDHTQITFPESFLKKWLKTQGASDNAQAQKTDEQVEKEFPGFINQLKWTLISDKLVKDNNIEVTPEEIRQLAKQQLFGYMGMNPMDEEQPWVKDYIEKMMKERKFVEDAYHRLQTQKIYEWAEGQVKTTDKEISAEEFTRMQEEHHH